MNKHSGVGAIFVIVFILVIYGYMLANTFSGL